MTKKIVTREEMLKRVAIFSQLTAGSRPLIDAVLPQYQRQIFNIIGSSVTEDPTMSVPIRAVEGFHISIIKAESKKGTGLHQHKTVEVFMPLTGQWSVQWGDTGDELTLNQWDVISVPTGIMRGFRNEGPDTAFMLSIVGGDNPGSVDWDGKVIDAARAKGFDLDAAGKIIEKGAAPAGRAV